MLVRLRFHKTLSISDPKNIDLLFTYIDAITRFHHIEFNGLPYYETQNDWMFRKIKKRPDYDVDDPCDGYLFCDRDESPICPTNNDTIKYVLKYYYDDNKKYNKFISKISSYKLKNILLIGFNKLIIRNNCEKNDYHPGSNHCNVFLQTYDKINVRKYMTLYDLAIAYYKLKSHKWDKKYEHFVGSKTKIDKKKIEILLEFNHRYDD
jgi:hypothetical protein